MTEELNVAEASSDENIEPSESKMAFNPSTASIEELDALIEGRPLEKKLEVEDDSKEPEAVEAKEPEEELSEDVSDEESLANQPKEDDSVASEKSQEELAAAQKKRREELEARLAQQEQFIQRLKSENGQHRAERKKLKAQLEELLQEQREDDPYSAIETKQRLEQVDKELEQIDAQEQQAARIHNAQKVVAAHLREGEDDLDGMAEVLKSDGVPENVIQAFRVNPFSVASPETIIQLGKRQAIARKQETTIHKLADYALSLERKLKDYEKKNSPDDVVSGIKKAMNGSAQLTAKSGSASKPSSVASLDPAALASLSNEELDNILKG